jgi:hypothetical protein
MPATLGSGTYGSGTYGGADGKIKGPRIAMGREYPPDDLALRIDPPKGAPARWAADEPLAENVASDIRLVDEMPGGDKEGSTVLARDPRQDYPDLAPFSTISVYGPGVEEVANYRLDKTPQSDGDRIAITSEAVGWSKALEDNKGLIGPGFIDGDFSKFTDPPIQRRIRLIELGRKLVASFTTGFQGGGESDAAALVFEFLGSALAAGNGLGEAWRPSDEVAIGRILYDYRQLSSWAAPDSKWRNRIYGSKDAGGVEVSGGTDHQHQDASFASLDIEGDDYFYAFIENIREEALGGEWQNADSWSNIKILGRHGLALQGAWPEVGFTVAQMLAWAIPRFTVLEARPEDLEDTGYIVQQAWFSDPGPMSQVVQELTKYELLDWFVFGDRRFKLKRPGTYGRRWQAYSGPSGLEEIGFDADRCWKEILVTGQDVDGRQISVGPIGSGATVESDALEITDPDHPAVRAAEEYGPNFLRRDRLSLRGISTPARMIEAGEVWLREANQLDRSGQCALSGYAMDDRGIMRPVSQIRAGDQVRFPDAGDTSYRRIVRRSYEHSARTAQLDLDAPPEAVQALLERLDASIQSLAL